jgi:hypothetical protein
MVECTVQADLSSVLHTDACVRITWSVHRHADRPTQAAAKQLLPMLLAISQFTDCDSTTTVATSTTRPTAEQLRTLLQAILVHLSPQHASSSTNSSTASSAVTVQHGATDVYLTLLWALVLKQPNIFYSSHDATGTQVLLLHRNLFES